MKKLYFVDIDNFKIIEKTIIKETNTYYMYWNWYNEKVPKNWGYSISRTVLATIPFVNFTSLDEARQYFVDIKWGYLEDIKNLNEKINNIDKFLNSKKQNTDIKR